LDLDQVLRRIVDAAVYLTRADEGFLALVDEQSEQLHLRAIKDVDQNQSTVLNLHLNDSTAGAAIRNGCPVRMHTTIHGHSLKIGTGYLVHSLLHVPIFSKGTALGVLSVDNRVSKQPFTEMDEILLTSLADYAAVAMENAQLYEQAQQELGERKRAEEQLAASLREKQFLLQEIHHRVKNNLQVISSLLNLQAGQVQDSQVLNILRDSQYRIRSMAMIHEKLYRSTDVAQINMGEYIRELAVYLFQAYNASGRGIKLQLLVEDLILGIDPAVTCGVLLNELISNALKHAFPDGRGGEIRIEFQAGPDGRLTLVVADDGVGFPPGSDLYPTKSSLGLQLVHALTTQLEGTVELECQHGTRFTIKFRDNHNTQ
jgi:two-component sensor histidine kinase